MYIYSKNSNSTQFWEIIWGDWQSYFTINYYFILNTKLINSYQNIFQLRGERINEKYERKTDVVLQIFSQAS